MVNKFFLVYSIYMCACFVCRMEIIVKILINILLFGFQMKKDFVTWLRMFLIFMIAGGITIQAVLYPNYYPLDESIIMALSRAFFGMFLTKIDDLDSKFYSCMFPLQYNVFKNVWPKNIVYKLVPFSRYVSQCNASKHQNFVRLSFIDRIVIVHISFLFLQGNEKCERFYDNQTKKVCYSK